MSGEITVGNCCSDLHIKTVQPQHAGKVETAGKVLGTDINTNRSGKSILPVTGWDCVTGDVGR